MSLRGENLGKKVVDEGLLDRMEAGLIKAEASSCAFQCSSDTLLSIQLLEFKTSLLEVVEELRMNRDAKNQYEEQISKILLEKQELEWQNNTLLQQSEILTKQHKEATTAFKKQLQARMCDVEEEKGKYQLAAETKEKEITGLKEDLKTLQIVKYNLEKKLMEMEQKVQLHILAKDDHLKQLSEVEKCCVSIAHQFGVVKEVHEKLEQNVHAVIQLNQKLTSVNKKKELEIDYLKQELKKLTTDLLKSKVICRQRAEEKNISLIEKEQQLQELQQKLQMENEINKMLNEENAHIKGEKQEIIHSLQHLQELLQRQTQAMFRVEAQLNALKEDNQILERDNGLQREKAKENEQNFLNLQNEHEKSLGMWKKDNVLQPDQLNETLNKQTDKRCTEVKTGDKNQCGEEQNIDKQNMEECILEFIESQGEYTNELYEEHRNEIVPKDFQAFENAFEDQEKVTKLENKQQTNIPLSKTLCSDRLKNKQPTEVYTSEYNEPAVTNLTKSIHSAELESECSPGLLAKFPLEKEKMFLGNTEALGACSTNAGQQTDSNKHIFGTTTNKIDNITDKTDITQNDNELPNEEIQLVPGTGKSSMDEEILDNRTSEYNSSKTNGTHDYKCSLQESSCNCLVNKPDKTQQLNEKAISLTSAKLSSEQVCADQQDTADKKDEGSRLNSISDSITKVPILLTNDDTRMGKDLNIKTSQNISLPLINTEEFKKGTNWKDVQNSTEQIENHVNVPVSSISIAQKKTNIYVSQDTDAEMVSNITNKMTMDILLSSEIGQNVKKDERLLLQNETALLSNIREPLSSAHPERQGSKGWQEESCSTLTKPSADSVNKRVRSAFDLKTSEKNTEKSSVYLHFSDLNVFPRLNQAESQIMNTSTSKVSFLFSEKITQPEENKEISSKILYQNPVVDAVMKQSISDSPSIRKLTDILNISCMKRDPRRDHSEEWNAISQTFYDSSFPTEQTSVLIGQEKENREANKI